MSVVEFIRSDVGRRMSAFKGGKERHKLFSISKMFGHIGIFTGLIIIFSFSFIITQIQRYF